MKDRYLVGNRINLVSLFEFENGNKININFKDGSFRNIFLNYNSQLLLNPLEANIVEVIVTDVGHFSPSICQYFATVAENNTVDNDLVGSFSQGTFFLDTEINPINCFIWKIAHPSTKCIEFIDYNTLKYILSIKAESNHLKASQILSYIDSFL